MTPIDRECLLGAVECGLLSVDRELEPSHSVKLFSDVRGRARGWERQWGTLRTWEEQSFMASLRDPPTFAVKTFRSITKCGELGMRLRSFDGIEEITFRLGYFAPLAGWFRSCPSRPSLAPVPLASLSS